VPAAPSLIPPLLCTDSGSVTQQALLLLLLLLPLLLYRLLPCAWTAWLALRCACDEPLGEEPGMRSVRLAARCVRKGREGE
jgi:hypothetical protein